jgi:hypothetical protein
MNGERVVVCEDTDHGGENEQKDRALQLFKRVVGLEPAYESAIEKIKLLESESTIN